MSKKETFYVTTPIYYVNDTPHIGHAYTTLAADIIARFKRQQGLDVFFLTGTDEHGIKIAESAKAKGKSPKVLVDEISQHFVEMCSRLNVTNDYFIRTTDPRHEQVVQNIYMMLKEKGDIYLGEYEGFYHTADENFITETEYEELKGTPEEKYITRVKEKNYFFKLSKYERPLIEYIEAHPEFVQPDYRRNEVLGYLRKGLKDLSITRTSFDWGVKVPDDPEHVIYVWIDALTNYLSALGYSLDDDEKFRRYWPADFHIIGKDILVFHAIYWPAILMALNLPLPKTVYAHGWWTANGAKISKRAGNVIDPYEMIERYGLDRFRYFLFRENVFGRDGDFSEPALIRRVNSELLGDIGNLLNRTLGMTKKYTQNHIPQKGEPIEGDTFANDVLKMFETYVDHMERLEFREALEQVVSIADAGNKYIVVHEPWALHKLGDSAKLNTVLYNVLEGLRFISVMLAPFMPDSAAEMQRQLGMEPDFSIDSCKSWGALEHGAQLGESKILFEKIEDDVLQDALKRQKEVLERLRAIEQEQQAESKPSKVPEPMEKIDFDTFAKVDLRIAKILEAKKHPKADRLLVLSIDVGEAEPRTLVAGIAEQYSPDELVGKYIVVVANLKPRKLRGIESNGMLLAATHPDTGRIVPLTVPEDVLPGTKIS